MGAVTSGLRTRTRSAVSRARWMLLVMAVVAGVLAMHGLSPSGMPSAGQHVMTAPLGEAGQHAVSADAGDSACPHVSGADDGGMAMDHVGGSCAAKGTAASYVPPTLLPALAVPAEPSVTALGNHVARTVDGRAPPSLSELQLLRI
ncbi:DUF6153 family protein [Streptomyces sp. NPDC044780]|uniref:DUF6153 family protein n=1 Tax=unclassified Streptomyces TaxID=2593676 RepID=UPI0033D321B8